MARRTNFTCAESEKACKSSEEPSQVVCLTQDKFCNGVEDCFKGVDEKNCTGDLIFK